MYFVFINLFECGEDDSMKFKKVINDLTVPIAISIVAVATIIVVLYSAAISFTFF